MNRRDIGKMGALYQHQIGMEKRTLDELAAAAAQLNSSLMRATNAVTSEKGLISLLSFCNEISSSLKKEIEILSKRLGLRNSLKGRK